jgi:hypothetical protein
VARRAAVRQGIQFRGLRALWPVARLADGSREATKHPEAVLFVREYLALARLLCGRAWATNACMLATGGETGVEGEPFGTDAPILTT